MPDDPKGSTEWRLIPDPSNPADLELHRGPRLVARQIVPGSGVEDLLKEAAEGRKLRGLREGLNDDIERDPEAILDLIFPGSAAEMAESREMVLGEVARLAGSSHPTTRARLRAISGLAHAAELLQDGVDDATAHLAGAADGD